MEKTDTSMFKASLRQVRVPQEESVVFSVTKLVKTPSVYRLPHDFVIPEANEKFSGQLFENKHLFTLFSGKAQLVRRLAQTEKQSVKSLSKNPMLTFRDSNNYVEGDYLITDIDTDRLPRDRWLRNSQKIMRYPSQGIGLEFRFGEGCEYTCIDPSPSFLLPSAEEEPSKESKRQPRYPQQIKNSSFLYFSTKPQEIKINRPGFLFSNTTKEITYFKGPSTYFIEQNENVLLFSLRFMQQTKINH